MITPVAPTISEWLKFVLRNRNISQRQLAQRCGIDHSTISYLVRGHRMPSLETMTKLARGMGRDLSEVQTPPYFWPISVAGASPLARVESALRADAGLSEPRVRRIMAYYLGLRDGRGDLKRSSGTWHAERDDPIA